MCPESEDKQWGDEKSDRRVQRSKRALREALVQLMIEKGYEETTVADIAERADVGRSTFYTHYADKEDLLQGSLSDNNNSPLTTTTSPHPSEVGGAQTWSPEGAWFASHPRSSEEADEGDAEAPRGRPRGRA
jgi:transposase-like protein